MFIVGLTGGIGSGKSTAATIFEKYVDVINADETARNIVKPGSPALTTIAAHFGKSALLEDGSLNRAWLRDKIFSDLNEKKWLENLLHPHIRTAIIASLHHSQTPYCILMSPLLLETDQHLLTDRILVIDTSNTTQIERVVKRDKTSDAAVRAIMNTQLSHRLRLQRADDVILNSSDITNLEKSVHYLHNIYLTLAALS